jgi:hypothetical protein
MIEFAPNDALYYLNDLCMRVVPESWARFQEASAAPTALEATRVLDALRARPAPWAFRVCAYTLSKVFGLCFEQLVRISYF